MRIAIGLALLLVSTTALAEVPLSADSAEFSKDHISIHGTTAARARVYLYADNACETEPVAKARAGRGGDYVVKLPRVVEPPFTISLRAEDRGEESVCVAAGIQPPDEEPQPAADPEPAPPPPPPLPPATEKPKADSGLGMCMGIATRCDLLPKGICYMQAGCFNPAFGDRCGGSAKYCTHFHTKNACFMQRGCTWVKN